MYIVFLLFVWPLVRLELELFAELPSPFIPDPEIAVKFKVLKVEILCLLGHRFSSRCFSNCQLTPGPAELLEVLPELLVPLVNPDP